MPPKKKQKRKATAAGTDIQKRYKSPERVTPATLQIGDEVLATVTEATMDALDTQTQETAEDAFDGKYDDRRKQVKRLAAVYFSEEEEMKIIDFSGTDGLQGHK